MRGSVEENEENIESNGITVSGDISISTTYKGESLQNTQHRYANQLLFDPKFMESTKIQYTSEGLSISASLTIDVEGRVLIPDCFFTTSDNERDRNIRVYIKKGAIMDQHKEERSGKGPFFMKLNVLSPIKINKYFINYLVPFQDDIIRILSNSFETSACLMVFSAICDNACVAFPRHVLYSLDLLTSQVHIGSKKNNARESK